MKIQNVMMGGEGRGRRRSDDEVEVEVEREKYTRNEPYDSRKGAKDVGWLTCVGVIRNNFCRYASQA
jgi:hypothetical protein